MRSYYWSPGIVLEGRWLAVSDTKVRFPTDYDIRGHLRTSPFA